MMRTLFIFTFVAALLIGLASRVPLSFIMRNSGATAQGLSWQQARGTIWNGQITGLGLKGNALGAIDMKLSPLKLITGSAPSRFDWISDQGRARGDIAISRKNIRLNNTDVNLFVGTMSGLHPEIQKLGGALSLKNLQATFDLSGTCKNASGDAQTDILQRLGTQYGRNWPNLTGDVSCANGAFALPLQGQGPAGETFRISINVTPTGTIEQTIEVEGLDGQASIALQSMGFTPSGKGFVLHQVTTF
ncbi:MAG: type II secretion system protein N [Hyphomonas sp.]